MISNASVAAGHPASPVAITTAGAGGARRMSRATAGSRRGAQLSGRSGEAYHILVVDDSAMSRKMLMKCLKGEGHTCEEAEDGAQAVAMVRDKVRTHLTHLFLVLPRVRLSTVPITTHPPLAVAVGSPTPTTAS